jgi:hypothetical protein
MHLLLSFMVDGAIMEAPDIMGDTVVIMEAMVITVTVVVGITDVSKVKTG